MQINVQGRFERMPKPPHLTVLALSSCYDTSTQTWQRCAKAGPTSCKFLVHGLSDKSWTASYETSLRPTYLQSTFALHPRVASTRKQVNNSVRCIGNAAVLVHGIGATRYFVVLPSATLLDHLRPIMQAGKIRQATHKASKRDHVRNAPPTALAKSLAMLDV
eukprot:5048657-Amphidinium_carterae.1